jgi:hypothetical protein
MSKTPEQKAAAKAHKRAKKAAAFARDNRVSAPTINFAPAEDWNKIVREGAAEDRHRALRNIGQE